MAASKFIKQRSVQLEPNDVQYVLEGKGLCVDQKYRGRGIAIKMLEARVPFLETLGLTTTVTLFTAKGSQIAAQRAGYDEYCEVT